MRRTFVDPVLQERFEREGYVVIPLLDADEVAAVRAIHERHLPQANEWDPLPANELTDRRRAVWREVGAIVRRKLDPLLDGYRLLYSLFLVDGATGHGGDNGLQICPSKGVLHQDWTIVGDEDFSSVQLLCALTDTDRDNGCVIVAPGSHRAPHKVPVGGGEKWHSATGIDAVKEFTRALPMKSGEALLYDGRLLHGFAPRQSQPRRVSLSGGAIPDEAEPRILFEHPDRPGELELLGVSEDFFWKDPLGEQPKNARHLGWIAEQGSRRVGIAHHPHPLEEVTRESFATWSRAAAEPPRKLTECAPSHPPRRAFRDDALEAKLDRDGYAVVDLLNEGELAQLRQLYEDIRAEVGTGFYTSLWSENLRYRGIVHFAVRRLFQGAIERLLCDWRIVLGNFAVKRAGEEDNACPLHQDWSFTDNRRYRELTVWSPQIDVDGVNGNLAVVPGSHRFRDDIRPNGVLAETYFPFAESEGRLRQHIRELPMRAGSAVIYDSRLLHASRSARLAADRVASVAVVIPREAPLWHYWRVGPAQLEVWEVGEHFYWKDVILGQPPKIGTRRGIIEQPALPFTDQDCDRVFGISQSAVQPSI